MSAFVDGVDNFSAKTFHNLSAQPSNVIYSSAQNTDPHTIRQYTDIIQERTLALQRSKIFLFDLPSVIRK